MDGERAAPSAPPPGPCPCDATSSPSTLMQAPVVILATTSSAAPRRRRAPPADPTGEEPSLSWMKWTFLLSRRVLTQPRAVTRFAGGAFQQAPYVAVWLNHCDLVSATALPAGRRLVQALSSGLRIVAALLQFQQQRDTDPARLRSSSMVFFQSMVPPSASSGNRWMSSLPLLS